MSEPAPRPRLVFLHQGMRAGKHRCKACGKQESVVVEFAKKRPDVEVMKSNVYKSGEPYVSTFGIKGTPAFALHVPGEERPRIADRMFDDVAALAAWIDAELTRSSAPQPSAAAPKREEGSTAP